MEAVNGPSSKVIGPARIYSTPVMPWNLSVGDLGSSRVKGGREARCPKPGKTWRIFFASILKQEMENRLTVLTSTIIYSNIIIIDYPTVSNFTPCLPPVCCFCLWRTSQRTACAKAISHPKDTEGWIQEGRWKCGARFFGKGGGSMVFIMKVGQWGVLKK